MHGSKAGIQIVFYIKGFRGGILAQVERMVGVALLAALAEGDPRDIPWVTFGKRSKKGHPHHPLYLRKDSTPEPFDVENYLDTCF